MINREATIKWKGYDPDGLSDGSQKRVWAVCDGCGKGRWLNYQAYRDLCYSCARKQLDTSGKNNPMWGRTHSQSTRDKIGNAERGEKHHNYGKRLPKDTCKKISDGKKGDKNPFYGKKHTEESKRKIGDSVRGVLNHWSTHEISEEVRKKMSENHADVSGENNPNWKGGLSFGIYCEKFNNDLKERVREFFGRQCYVCGKTEEENGARLSIHHVNYDKMVCCNDISPLFVPLCRGCHAKTHGNRYEWENIFTMSLEYLTGGQCYETKE